MGTDEQGLALIHFSAQRKHYLRDTLGVSGGLSDKSGVGCAQEWTRVELISGLVEVPAEERHTEPMSNFPLRLFPPAAASMPSLRRTCKSSAAARAWIIGGAPFELGLTDGSTHG